MKKRIIIAIIAICLLIVMGVIFLSPRINSTIILDINPSIQMDLNKDNEVIRVKALNDDAKDIVNSNLKGKNISESISILTDNLIKDDYAKDDIVAILLYTTGNVKIHEIENIIRNSFDEKQVQADIFVIENVTDDDKKLAKKNNISIAKAAYINEILKENSIDSNVLINKSVRELIETRNTGNYCDDDYFLEGGDCLKEISRRKADSGMICPNGYYEYNEVCYEEGRTFEKDNLICQEEFTMNGKLCTRLVVMDAEPVSFSCPSGEAKTRAEMGLTNSDAGDANNIVCVDFSSATHPVTPCELPPGDPTERMSYGGRCYWHRAPVIPEGCPGSIQVAGECWQDATNIYICQGYRDGKQYQSRDEYCEHSIKYIDPVVTEYKCSKDYTLNGNKCEKEETAKPMHEKYCIDGYTLVNNDRCINYDKTTIKVDGYVCNEENTKLKGDYCVTYEIIDAIHTKED